MDIPRAIDLNKTLLAGIIAGISAMLRGAGEAVPARIPAGLHRAIVRLLRPAESAVRRLIVVLVTITGTKAPPPRAQQRSLPKDLARTGAGKKRQSFALFDPRQHFGRQRPSEKKSSRAVPRVISFDNEGLRRFKASLDALHEADKKAEDLSPLNLLRRLEAMTGALGDLPGQARRLVRALARRQSVPHLKLKMPLRPGRAPGWRVKPRLDIDRVLRECDWLARNALTPDTS